jgi:hypothetical protein
MGALPPFIAVFLVGPVNSGQVIDFAIFYRARVTLDPYGGFALVLRAAYSAEKATLRFTT